MRARHYLALSAGTIAAISYFLFGDRWLYVDSGRSQFQRVSTAWFAGESFVIGVMMAFAILLLIAIGRKIADSSGTDAGRD